MQGAPGTVDHGVGAVASRGAGGDVARWSLGDRDWLVTEPSDSDRRRAYPPGQPREFARYGLVSRFLRGEDRAVPSGVGTTDSGSVHVFTEPVAEAPPSAESEPCGRPTACRGQAVGKHRS